MIMPAAMLPGSAVHIPHCKAGGVTSLGTNPYNGTCASQAAPRLGNVSVIPRRRKEVQHRVGMGPPQEFTPLIGAGGGAGAAKEIGVPGAGIAARVRASSALAAAAAARLWLTSSGLHSETSPVLETFQNPRSVPESRRAHFSSAATAWIRSIMTIMLSSAAPGWPSRRARLQMAIKPWRKERRSGVFPRSIPSSQPSPLSPPKGDTLERAAG